MSVGPVVIILITEKCIFSFPQFRQKLFNFIHCSKEPAFVFIGCFLSFSLYHLLNNFWPPQQGVPRTQAKLETLQPGVSLHPRGGQVGEEAGHTPQEALVPWGRCSRAALWLSPPEIWVSRCGSQSRSSSALLDSM